MGLLFGMQNECHFSINRKITRYLQKMQESRESKVANDLNGTLGDIELFLRDGTPAIGALHSKLMQCNRLPAKICFKSDLNRLLIDFFDPNLAVRSIFGFRF